MAKSKLNNCLVGLELAGDRIRLAAITAGDSGATGAESRRLHCDEIVIPAVESCSPATLPPAATLLPLIKAALARMGVGRGDVAVALGGPRMVLRYFVGADDLVQAELQEAIDRSINYVRFGLGDRVVGEHAHKMSDGRAHALLAVSAAATIDPLVKALEQAGLCVKLVEPRLVTLTRIASLSGRLNGEPALLVIPDSCGMDIGVVCDGHVLFSHQPLSPGGGDEESGAAGAADGLQRELEKMSRHYVRAFAADEDVRKVLLCGLAEQVHAHVESLAGSSDFDVGVLAVEQSLNERLALSLEPAALADVNVVALGAAAGLTNAGGNIVGPNLTSEPQIQRRPSLDLLVRAALWPTLAAMLIWGAIFFFKGNIQQTVAKMQIAVDHPSPVETTYRQLQMERTKVEQRAGQLREFVAGYQHRDSTAVLEAIRACIREGLWLSRVRLSADQQLVISGAADKEGLVYQLRTDLDGAPLIEDATITTTDRAQRGRFYVTEFSLECTLTPGASGS